MVSPGPPFEVASAPSPSFSRRGTMDREKRGIMAKTEMIQVRVDATLKAQAEGVLQELGSDASEAIRRVARFRLVDPRLRRQLDSMDICQSVLASFFVRASLGEYALETPDDLLRLLAAMTRNKLAFQARHQKAAKRDHRRVEPGRLE